MRLVELRDINRGVVYVNPALVQLVHAEGKGSLILMQSGGVLIVNETVLTVLHRLMDTEITQ
jgi:hypothetical protein